MVNVHGRSPLHHLKYSVHSVYSRYKTAHLSITTHCYTFVLVRDGKTFINITKTLLSTRKTNRYFGGMFNTEKFF